MKYSIYIAGCTIGLMMWVFTGCGAASVHKSTRSLSFKDDINIVYAAGAFAETPSLVQQVTYERDGEILEFTAMVDIAQTSVTIAGLSSLGQRQFLLTIDDTRFAYDAEPLFELPFPPQYLMRDFMLIYASRDELLRQQPGLSVTDDGQQRVVGLDGRPLMTVSYEPRETRSFATGDVVLQHTDGYTLRVATVQVNVSSVVTRPSDE